MITTILNMTALTGAGILLTCGAYAQDAPDAPAPVDRPSVADSLPELPKRFRDCTVDWDRKDGIPASVIIFRAGQIERVTTEEAWAPLEFFGGTPTTTDDHWILGSCTDHLDTATK